MTEKFELTNQTIKKEFLSLLQTNKFYKITVNQICNAANISRITFYRHYSDKFELLEDINNDKINVLQNYIRQRLHEKDISRILLQMTDFLEKDAEDFKQLFKINKLENQNCLEDKLKILLQTEFSYFITNKHSKTSIRDIPVTYLSELYAANATIFIKYSLQGETTQKLVGSLNTLQTLILEFLKTK
ncbi:TetR family transcriptional regulator [Liquorilactobacillus hordei]|uniref:TetR family transcriptional regulator n=2 Tax=Liquorilactobacillus hordei TaxID=468911 RepID=UPI001CBF4EF6|nr:TetR/AcrR family transcriptional regulator [Liquorilactobacillus hordei]